MVVSVLAGLMFNKLLLALTAFLTFITTTMWRRKKDGETGRTEQKLDDTEAILDDIHQADVIRDKLNSDPEYRNRVQDRFTRK